MEIKEVLPNVYTFEVVLPKSPLRALNSYVIKGSDQTILFDTGFNTPESKESLFAGLEQLDVKPEDVTVILTHLHSDHCGLAPLFEEAGADIYASEVDAQYIQDFANPEGAHWRAIDEQKYLFGMLPGEVDLSDHPGFKYRMSDTVKLHHLVPGDTLSVGDYHFEVVDLIGHTPGHIGFYEKEKNFLIGGDTVLDPMTPNITYWGENYPNILQSYIDTLEKLKTLNLKMILPTHRQIIYNPNERMDEIIEHHYERLQEMLDAMEPERQYTTRDISALITWRIKADSWEDFPKGQKWFAAGETLAHLEYLYDLGYLTKEQNEAQAFLFTKVKDKLIE